MSYACQFHSEGSPHPWGNYNLRGPSASQFRAPPALRLLVPAMVVGKTNQATDLEIDVTVLSSLVSSPQVMLKLLSDQSAFDIEQADITIDASSGRHAFSVVPTTAGTYRLVVVASVLGHPEIAEQRKTIYLRVSA